MFYMIPDIEKNPPKYLMRCPHLSSMNVWCSSSGVTPVPKCIQDTKLRWREGHDTSRWKKGVSRYLNIIWGWSHNTLDAEVEPEVTLPWTTEFPNVFAFYRTDIYLTLMFPSWVDIWQSLKAPSFLALFIQSIKATSIMLKALLSLREKVPFFSQNVTDTQSNRTVS